MARKRRRQQQADQRHALTLVQQANGTYGPGALSPLSFEPNARRAGGYPGASRDRQSTLLWHAPTGDANVVTLDDLPVLRQRSRDLVRRSGLAASIVNTKVTSIIGTGLRPKSRINAEVLGMTDAQKDAWERRAEDLFAQWAESTECDITRTQNFYELQALEARTELEDGEVFTLLTQVTRPGSPFGLKCQLIEADRVADPLGHMPTRTQYGGIKFDEYGAPTAYSVLEMHRENIQAITPKERFIDAFDSVTGRRNLLHIFEVRRPGLVRGVPDLAPVMEVLWQLSKYLDSELTSAQIAACFTAIVTSQYPLSQGTSLLPESTSEITASREGMMEDLHMQPGLIIDGGYGTDVKLLEHKRPNSGVAEYILMMLRQVGAGVEMPLEILIKHFVSSYSASRAAMLQFGGYVRRKRTFLARKSCQPKWDALITEAVASGYLEAPGFFDDPVRQRAYLGAEWIGPSLGQINEKDEIDAAILRMSCGLTTREEERAQLLGSDWESIVPQLRKEAAILTDLGFNPQPSVNPQNNTPASTPDEP